MNILVKFVSFYLERFQRYSVLKNVQLFWATLYIWKGVLLGVVSLDGLWLDDGEKEVA